MTLILEALTFHAAIMCVALLIDCLIGWPPLLFRWFGHPVSWFGALIDFVDRRFNTDNGAPQDVFWSRRRWGGVVLVLLVLVAAIGPMALISRVLPFSLAGLAIGAIIAWPFFAVRSLHQHVGAVATPLTQADLPAARLAVGQIVGRDVKALDDAGVARAALESLAENSSDGVVAPLFWGLLFGLPGVVAYKAVNTMDSMVGHKTPRYQAFGWAAARLDDGLNLIPARLTGLGFALVSGKFLAVMPILWRDARRHRSPNAGWAEAAMAAALHVRLSGPRRYGPDLADEPWLNALGRDPDHESLWLGLALYRRLVGMLLLPLFIVSLLVIVHMVRP